MAEQPLQVTFKAGDDYAAPWLIVNAGDVEDLMATLLALEDADTLETIAALNGVFVAARGLGGTTVEKTSTPARPAAGPKPAKAPTANQLKFLHQLQDERGLDNTTPASAEECSALIDELKETPAQEKKQQSRGRGFQGRGGGGQRGKSGGGKGPSEKQIALVNRLINEKDTSGLPEIPDDDGLRGMTGQEVSNIIEALINAPDAPAGDDNPWG